MPKLTKEQKTTLEKIVAKNLKSLIEAMKWSQSGVATSMGIAEATLTNYLNPEKSTGRLPPLDFLVGLCMEDELKSKGLEITPALLLSEKFNPKALIEKRFHQPVIVRKDVAHSDFLGNYICYFFEQNKPVHNQDHKLNRGLRYGVISVFSDCESFTGDVNVRATAAFFKEESAERAFELKRKLDHIFKSNDNMNDLNNDIEEAFKAENVATYEGDVTFSDHHTFISIRSDGYGDNALIILYSPPKRADIEYIGGIGSVASIARGRNQMPAAQKIIISKYELGCSRDVVAEHLRMATTDVAQDHEAQAICDFCKKLYLDQDYARHFDDEDKAALIRRRLDQLVKNYIVQNSCCVGTITEDEDRAIFNLIEQYRD